MNNKDELKQTNIIAYNTKLRQKLKELHEMLGEEITDVACGMIGDKEHFHTKAKDILKHLSELTSKMSVLLIEAKESKKKLSNEEKKDYLMIAKLTETLGNLQYKLNQLIKNMNVSDDEKEVFTTETLAMMDSITDAQEQFRKVRVEINDFGIMSNNPDIATAFDYEEK